MALRSHSPAGFHAAIVREAGNYCVFEPTSGAIRSWHDVIRSSDVQLPRPSAQTDRLSEALLMIVAILRWSPLGIAVVTAA